MSKYVYIPTFHYCTRVHVSRYGYLEISRLLLLVLSVFPPLSLPAQAIGLPPLSSLSSTKKLQPGEKRQENRLSNVILFVARGPALCWVEEFFWFCDSSCVCWCLFV